MRTLREGLFLTQVELAVKAGITESTVVRLERGKQSARISTIRKLAIALGVQPIDLTQNEERARDES